MGEAEDRARKNATIWIRQRWPAARVLHEVGLEHGQVRADIVTLTRDELHGFELKSHADTVRRLPEQVRVYGETMDRATLMVSGRLYAAALPILPAWWGVCILRGEGQVETVREGLPNPAPVPLTTARLLWRDEALAVLRELGKGRGMSKLAKLKLYRALLEALPGDGLRQHVRHRLLVREGWKPPG